MKTQHFILFLLFLLLTLFQSCKKDLPTSATIITGKVVDENNMPVMGVNFHFLGSRPKGLSAIYTFNLYTYSDNNGIYTTSIVIPDGTNEVWFEPSNSLTVQFGVNYNIFLQKDNAYIDPKIPILVSDYGKTLTYNFQIRKK